MSLHPNIKLLSLFNFLLDFRFYAPVAIIYFSEVAGSYALGMSIFSITMVTSAVFEVPTGIYSDMIGRQRTLLWGALVSLLSVIFYALGAHYYLLVIGAMLEGLARAFYSGNNEALLHDTLVETHQEEEYARYLGKTSSMFQWALAGSAVIGGILAYFSYQLVMWTSVIPAILGVLVVLRMTEPKVHREKTTNIFVHLKDALVLFRDNYRLRLLSLAEIVDYAVGESSYLFRAAFVTTLWPLWAVGLAKMLTNIGAALSFEFSGKIIAKFKAVPVLMFGKLMSWLIGLIALGFPTVLSPALAAGSSLFFGTDVVASGALLQKEYSPQRRSTMASLNSLFGSIAFAGVAFTLGMIADMVGPIKALLLLKVVGLLPIFLIWQVFKKRI